MAARVYGAFTLLVVVNGQDVRVQCSICGNIRRTTVDRAETVEASQQLHIANHIRFISEQARHYNPLREPRLDGDPQ